MKGHYFIATLLLACSFSFAQDIEKGKKLMYYQRWEGAEQTFEQILKTDPANQEASYWLSEVLIEEKHWDEARSVHAQLHNYFASHPGTEEDLLVRVMDAELKLQAGDSTAASVIFEDVLKETKQKDPDILVAIVKASLHTNSPDYENLLYLLEKAEKRDKKNPEIFCLRGDIYRRLNRGGEAVKAYQEATEKDPSFAEAAYKIGKIYLTQNNPDSYLQYFQKSVASDPAYAPAYYELYYYYYFRDVNKAREYLDKYIANTDASTENDYMLTDLLYASSKSQEAIEKAKSILNKETNNAQPRLYKLIAYSYDALGDSAKALEYLNQYFQKEADTNYVARDFALRAKLLDKFGSRDSAVISDLETALKIDTLNKNKLEYASRLAELNKKIGNKSDEARYLGLTYQLKDNPSNLDLYYWGMAHYSAGEYQKADSVFAEYTTKYPEHIQGFYWRAKSNALMDSTMENGLAIPYYQKVIEMASSDSLKNKSLLIQSYGYLGAYEANVKKDFVSALAHFEKILELDADNADALKYRDILRKWVKNETNSKSSETTSN
jgi:tetratricopeptide (TPR) repeat protein